MRSPATTLEGKELSLTDYAGKVVVLNVWGSWCPPCRKEARSSRGRVARARRRRRRRSSGVNTKDSSPEQGLAFQRRYDVPYPSFFDPAGRTLLAFHGTLNPSAIPSTVVLDSRAGWPPASWVRCPASGPWSTLVRDVQK